MNRSNHAYDALKRLLDVFAAVLLLALLAPVLTLIALLVRAKLGSPVLFRQVRPGKDGRPFTIHKFRTMRDAPAGTDALDAVATDAERLTRFGRLLRSTSLDELPELWNVIRGEMSMVGPRPLLTEYLERYDEEQGRRHEIRPGITGWAQVNGRNAVCWDERLKMDVWYVDHRSLALDLRVLGMTVAAVFGRSGISGEGHATMHPFDPACPTGFPEEDS